MKIILGAVISLPPYAPGLVWHWLNHLLGLQQLGHEVYCVEEARPDWCVDAQGQRCDFERSVNRRLFYETMSRFNMMERACLIYDGGKATFGLSRGALTTVAKTADLLINMSGHVEAACILENVRRRAYVDQDPVYTQLWYAEYGADLNFDKHEVFFTMGRNIGTAYSPIPDCNIHWHHLLPPVALPYWPCRLDEACERFSTVASWSDVGDLCYQGEWYRSKYPEFVRFAALPRTTNQAFEAVLKHFRPEDEGIRLLQANGWVLTRGDRLADLDAYQRYIAQSRAEVGIAKNAYVKGHSGWFSDRAAHYLASGKPVLAQATGFERWVPTGRGLFSFSSLEEAAAAIEAINADYAGHCKAARAFAEEYLDSHKVLSGMLEVCMA